MYVFNRITVNPQLPKRIGRITEIANKSRLKMPALFLGELYDYTGI